MKAVTILPLIVALSGCGAVMRPPSLTCGFDVDTVPTVAQSAAGPTGLTQPEDARPRGDGATMTARVAETLRSAVAAIPRNRAAEVDVLTLSSGGQFGAFGAGFLRGWAENAATPLPEFQLVTGVSAGAFLAPVAFAGREFAPLLDAQDGLDEAQVFIRNIPGVLFGRPSIASPAPLERVLKGQLTAPLIDRIAARHDDNATLLIAAVDLDTTRLDEFDLGDLAASDLPLAQKRDCLAEAMLASAAIPGLFPPRSIDGGLYADGGLRDHVFLRSIEDARRMVEEEQDRDLRINATIIVNGALDVPEGPVEDRLISYLGRSIATLTDELLRDSIVEAIEFAEGRRDWTVRGMVADVDLSACPDEALFGTFDQCVTSTLFRQGRRLGGATPIDWLSADELRARAREF